MVSHSDDEADERQDGLAFRRLRRRYVYYGPGDGGADEQQEGQTVRYP